MPNLVEIIVRARDTTKEGFASAEGGAASLGARLQKIGMVGGMALAAIAVESVKMAAKFDSSMELIHTQAGVAQNQIAGLKQGVLDLAGKVGFSPDSLAEALYHIESSFASVGIKGPQAMNLLKVAAQGAAIGHADLVDVTNALDAAIASGIPGVHNFSQAMGVLNATVGAGDMHMEDLAKAFGTGVLATVKGFGLTIKDVGAALATYGDNNIRGAQAGTALRVAVQALAAPVKAGIPILKQLGISTGQLAKDMQTGGLNKAITDLKTHMDAAGISATQQGQIITEAFGKKAGTGINILIGQFDRFKSKYTDMSRGAGQFGEAWNATNRTMAQQWKELDASVQALAIGIGEKLMPYAEKLMAFFTSHKSVVTDVAIGLGALVAALAVYAIGARAAAVATGLFNAVMDASPVTLVVLALAGLVAAFVLLWTKSAAFRDFWKTVWKDVQAVVAVVWAYLKQAFTAIADTVKGLWDKLVAWWNSYGGEIKAIWRAIWDSLLSAAKTFWSFFGPFIKAEWELISTEFKVALAVVEAVVKTAWDVIAAYFKIAWAAIEAVVKTAWDVIIGLFQVAIDLLTGHWSRAWHDLLDIGKQAWNNIRDFLGSTWNAIAGLAKQVFGNIASMLSGVWSAIEGSVKTVWGSISGVFTGIWNGLKSGFNTVVGAIKTTWNTLEGIFKTPVNFLIGTVYDNGIARLWNDVMGAIGGPKLPVIPGFSGGGKLSGYGGGDQHLALLESGEAVVDKDRTRKFAPLLKAMGVPGFGGGGVVGTLTGALGWLGSEAASLIADLASGGGAVLGKLLSKFIGTSATGELGQMMTGIPRTLIGDLIGSQSLGTAVKQLQSAISAATSAASSLNTSIGGGAGANAALARQMYPGWSTGNLWAAWNSVAMAESGWNRFAMNPSSGAYGIPQALPFTKMPKIAWPASAGGSSNAGAQIKWMHDYIAAVYSTPVQAWAHEQAYRWYGSGGIGGGMAMVGEHGRELVRLPHGSTVYPHGQSESMLARQGPVLVQLEVVSGGQGAFEQFMLKAFREWVRVKGGGSVQKAFGAAGK